MVKGQNMTTRIIVRTGTGLIALLAAAWSPPCMAQAGLYGLTSDGKFFEIDPDTAQCTLITDLNRPVRRMSGSGAFSVYVVTDDDVVIGIDPATGAFEELLTLNGQPPGSELTGFAIGWDEWYALRTSPVGAPDYFEIDPATGAYMLVGSTGTPGLVSMIGSRYAMDETGSNFLIDSSGQAQLYQAFAIPEPVRAGASFEHSLYAAGDHLWQLDQPPVQIGVLACQPIVDLASTPNLCDYADLECCTGAGRYDLFDFLAFQNYFVAGSPIACDCDVSTGFGVCDLFDFLCFQNAFAIGITTGCR